jgi:hypothetical protein
MTSIDSRSIGGQSASNTHASSGFATNTQRTLPFKNGLDTPDPYDINDTIGGKTGKSHPNPYYVPTSPRLTPVRKATPGDSVMDVESLTGSVNMKSKEPRLWDVRTVAPGVGTYTPEKKGTGVPGSAFSKDGLPSCDLPFKAPKTPDAYAPPNGTFDEKDKHNLFNTDPNGPRLAPIKSDSPGVGIYNPTLSTSGRSTANMKSKEARLWDVRTASPGVGIYSPSKGKHVPGSGFCKDAMPACKLPFKDGSDLPGPDYNLEAPGGPKIVDASFRSKTPRLSPAKKANPDGTPKKLDAGVSHAFSKTDRFSNAPAPRF